MRRFITARLTGIPLLLLVLAALVALVAGCGKGVTPPKKPVAQAPETELTFAPVANDTVSFRIHFYWNGYDNDGQVVAFRWAVDPDSATAKRPGTWARTTAKDTTLLFYVDPVKEVKRHEFLVAAEDNDGHVDPTPAIRYFSAKTLPPTSKIEKGPLGNNIIVGPNFTFEWSGIDPDGGETGGKAPVDSFQYLLLRIGGIADTSAIIPPWHQPLPVWDSKTYVTNLINAATGDTLPYPHGDWRWVGIHGVKFRFRNVTPGEYVFAIRAVDIAGATEKGLQIQRHIRHFTVSNRNPGPQLVINSSVLNTALPTASGPDDFARKPLQIFQGETISFSWTADASAYGGEVVGYNSALDDTSSLGASFDIKNTGRTFRPSDLPPGSHVLYIRCIDDGGLITNAVIPILIVHPGFKDPGAPREILYVDDSLSPGNLPGPNGSFPSDAVETSWWTLPSPGRPRSEARFTRITDAFPGTTVTEWDTYQEGLTGVEGRKQPEPKDLRDITTVVWVADANNTGGTPIALWKTLVGGNYSELAGYLRAGGTLVVTGWNLGNNSTNPTTMLSSRTRGLCSFVVGGAEWNLSYFPRLFMGISYVIPSEDGRRVVGARDFVAAYATPVGRQLGFDTAYVDTGTISSGAKWNTNSNLSVDTLGVSYLDQNYAPGLPRIEGWVMGNDPAHFFGCEDIRDFGREDQTSPIATPIYSYHGVNTGVFQDGAPSPREGRVVGVLCQSHDLGSLSQNGGVYNPAGALGRMVLIGFPLYFMKDQQASDVLLNAYTYVSQSPTLP